MFIIKLFIIVFLIVNMSGCGTQQDVSTSSSQKLSEQVQPSIDVKSKVTSTMENAGKDSYVEGELIVKFKADTKNDLTKAIHKSLGAEVKKSLGVIGGGLVELITINEKSNLIETAKKYMENENVLYAEPNYKRFIKAKIPNDTYFVRQWGLYNTGQMMNGSPGADIKAPLAWDYSKGDNSLIIAVIDTGVDYNHEDLFGKVWINKGEICNNRIDDDRNGYVDDCYGWNFVDNNNNPMDDQGHGTHVSGVIGAVSNNGLKIAGILWDVKIMALKFLDANGRGDVAGAVFALNYAVKMGAKVINASYGSSMYSQTEYDSIASANQKGVLFIAAAGNDAENNDISHSYPCNYGLPNIISVAASDMNDNIASFSNFGPNKVDVAAPGVYILSLIPNNGSGMNQDFWPGTSMATPFVVGLAGLVMTQQEYVMMNLSIYQVRALIENYVDILPAFAGKIKTGGRINAYKSVTALISPTDLRSDAFGPTSTERLRVHLNWKNNATGVDNIRIERMTVGKDTEFKEISQLSPTISSYTDFNVTGDTTYRYRVRAFKGFTQSYLPLSERNIYTFYSNSVEITTPTDTGYYAGSGGCSLVGNVNDLTKQVSLDAILLMVPLIVVVFGLVRRFR